MDVLRNSDDEKGILGNEDRTVINSPFAFPYSTVTAVDAFGGEGTGILISPNHVLTAAHNILGSLGRGFRVTTSSEEDSLNSRNFDGTSNVNNDSIIYPIDDSRAFASELTQDIADSNEDIAILKTDDPLLSATEVIGLLTFVDPQDAIGEKIETAGYPGDNVDSEIPGNSGEKGRDLIKASGTVNNIHDVRRFSFSHTIDVAKGQSGSGVWHELDGEPARVLGIVTQHAGTTISYNNGVFITTDLYHNIINSLPILDPDELPENAIVGSDQNDTIEGTWRRERILGGDGDDLILGMDGRDRLEGGDGNDVLYGGISGLEQDDLKGDAGNDLLKGGGGDDFLTGGADNDTLDGEEGTLDIAFFSGDFKDYDYAENSDGSITFNHARGTEEDGLDTLREVEFAQFNDTLEGVNNLAFTPSGGEDGEGNAAFVASETESAPRIIPLPLEDGVEHTEYTEVIDNTANPNPNDPPTPPKVSITAPVAMLDGDIDYTLNISPYEPDTEYNVVYVLDTSSSIDPTELQVIQDAYTDLTNFYINEGIAENINFGVVSYDSSGRFHPNADGDRNLTANEALAALQSLTIDPGIGTRYLDGLNQADQFLLNSTKNPFTTTGIGYFFTDGQNSSDRFDMLFKAVDVRELANFQAIGYYSDLDTLTSNSLKIRDVNWIDSNQGVFIDDINDLSTELLKSDLADDIVSVNILLNGEVVETLTPEQLTDTPLGLTYEGEIDELDVSIDAENIVTAEVVFTPESNFATTTVEHTVTAGESETVDENGNPIDQSGNTSGDDNPFERQLNGSEGDDEITLGYVDRGASGGAGGDYIIGNKRDNILDGGDGNDTIFAHEGDDTITPGAGNDTVDGGDGIDTVLYSDVVYQGNDSIFLRQAANSVNYNGTDLLTDIEFLQFSDVRISAKTLEVTPVLTVESEISTPEGDSGNSIVSVNFTLDTPAPVDIIVVLINFLTIGGSRFEVTGNR